MVNIYITLKPWVRLRMKSGEIYVQLQRRLLANLNKIFNYWCHYRKVLSDPRIWGGWPSHFRSLNTSHLLKATISLIKEALACHSKNSNWKWDLAKVWGIWISILTSRECTGLLVKFSPLVEYSSSLRNNHNCQNSTYYCIALFNFSNTFPNNISFRSTEFQMCSL